MKTLFIITLITTCLWGSDINVNLNCMVLTYRTNVYPIGAGRKVSTMRSITPVGIFNVVGSWKYGETDQWGAAFIRLSFRAWGAGYMGIHGTDDESSIGYYESSMCVRLSNAHILELFRLINTNHTVTIHGNGTQYKSNYYLTPKFQEKTK